jgi:ribonucrease Y
VVALPSDEMKGRIIGREGRNIRAFEQATGIDVIIDDTPEAVVLSGFDPIRRETARIALEKLVSDGRIHPAASRTWWGRAARRWRTGCARPPRRSSTSWGSTASTRDRQGAGAAEVPHLVRAEPAPALQGGRLLAGNMAAEMGFDATMAKRMGLLHDVGKGMTHEHEGTHVELGYNLCKKYNEPDQVLNAIKAHHDEEPHLYPETFLVTAADAISGSRPGARREMFETYVKRLEKLEEIATSFPGVERCFAIQAGRELRILVTPEQVSDEEMARLSEETARRIEAGAPVPGPDQGRGDPGDAGGGFRALSGGRFGIRDRQIGGAHREHRMGRTLGLRPTLPQNCGEVAGPRSPSPPRAGDASRNPKRNPLPCASSSSPTSSATPGRKVAKGLRAHPLRATHRLPGRKADARRR